MVPVEVHSYFSFMRGLNSPFEICQRLTDLGYESFGLVDTNGFYGLFEWREALEEFPLRAFLGVEILWQRYRFVAYIRNQEGFSGLCQLLSELHQEELDESRLWWHIESQRENIIWSTRDLKFARQLKERGHQVYFALTKGFFRHSDVQAARESKLPLLASPHTCYLEPESYKSLRLVRAIDENETLDTINIEGEYNTFSFLPDREQLESWFEIYADALENAQKLSETLSLEWLRPKLTFPRFNNLDEAGAARELRIRCYKQIAWRYPDPSEELREKVIERLEYELGIIIPKGFASYFLVVEDIVKVSKLNCGRGSGAASIVSYLLGITHVDPVKHDLFFDRFMNPEREDPPDIDIDFAWDERDDVLDYVLKKYSGHAAMVANHNYLRGKGAMREVAKVYGLPEDEISYIIERFPRVELSSLWQEIVLAAEKIQGIPRHLSVHCGGVVITPGPIRNYVPTEITPKGVPVIQWEKDQCEAAGLIKIDLLGNRSLAVIRDTIQCMREQGEDIDYDNLDPTTDTKTAELLETGQTMGVFYIESPATRLFLKKLKRADFENIVVAGSIIRPAANQWGNEYVRRVHGGHFQYVHPLLSDVLHETLGIMIYQEDVARVAMKLADFTSFEGNELRKTLDKKHKKKKLEHLKARFYSGAKKKGVDDQALETIWQMIMSFAGYSFCKPHSASYALVSMKAAYLKAHYPAEFMAAVISNQGGFYSASSYLDEARRWDLKILPPDVNSSEYHYTGWKRFIRTGLMQIKNLRSTCLDKILSEREKGGVFHSLSDFLDRVKPRFEDARSLHLARAFGSILQGKSHVALMWELYAYKNKKESVNLNLPALKEYSGAQFVRHENAILGSAVTFPEWALYKQAWQRPGLTSSDSLIGKVNQQVSLFGVFVTMKRVKTKYGEQMCFASFSDPTGIYETVFFPQVYEIFRDQLYQGSAFHLKGTVREEYDALHVEIQSSDLA